MSEENRDDTNCLTRNKCVAVQYNELFGGAISFCAVTRDGNIPTLCYRQSKWQKLRIPRRDGFGKLSRSTCWPAKRTVRTSGILLVRIPQNLCQIRSLPPRTTSNPANQVTATQGKVKTSPESCVSNCVYFVHICNI